MKYWFPQIFRLFLWIFLVDAVLALTILGYMRFKGLNEAEVFSNIYFFCGLGLMILGALSYQSNITGSRSADLLMSDMAGVNSELERSQQRNKDILDSFNFLIIAAFAGGIAILIALCLNGTILPKD